MSKEIKKEAASGSFEDLRQKINTALSARYGNMGADFWWSLEATFDDKIVVDVNGSFKEIPYSIKDDKVELGEPKDVKKIEKYENEGSEKNTEDKELKPERLSYESDFSEAKVNDEKREVEVTVIKSGVSKNRTNYSSEVLKAAADKGLYEGAKAFADHPTIFERKNLPERSVRNIVGVYKNTRYDEESQSIKATLKVFETANDIWLLIKEAIEEGLTEFIGISHVASGNIRETEIVSKRVKNVEEIYTIESADIVTKPAAGGKFEQLIASIRGDEFKTLEDLTADDIITKRKDIAKEILTIGIKESKVLEEREQNEMEIEEKIKELETRMTESQKMNDSKLLVTEMLAESKLPDLAKTRVKEKFEGKIATKEEIIAVIESEKKYIEEITPKTENVKGEGMSGAVITLTEGEKVQMGMDKLFGVDNDKGIPAFRGVRNAFESMFGADALFANSRGLSESYKPLIETIQTSDFAYILGTSMYKRMVKDYNLMSSDWRKIVTIDRPKDFKNQEIDRIGAFTDLSTVATESASYPELAALSDEQVTYAVITKGALVTVTRKAIINDDMRTLSKIPFKIARAANRTLEKYVFNTLLAATYAVDSKAVFHADHDNLGACPIGETALELAIAAVMKQSDGQEVIGIRPKFLLTPVDLQFTAARLLNSAYQVGATNETVNVLKGFLELIVVKYWTDTDDWMLICDPNEVEGVVLGFLNGQETPEMFLQDQANVDKVFTNDQIRYKVRHEYSGNVVDYRGMYKSVV